ncbi:MAG: hypothetical protein AAF984_09755 [Verrucomicrobiota bacterium]
MNKKLAIFVVGALMAISAPSMTFAGSCSDCKKCDKEKKECCGKEGKCCKEKSDEDKA